MNIISEIKVASIYFHKLYKILYILVTSSLNLWTQIVWWVLISEDLNQIILTYLKTAEEIVWSVKYLFNYEMSLYVGGTINY